MYYDLCSWWIVVADAMHISCDRAVMRVWMGVARIDAKDSKQSEWVLYRPWRAWPIFVRKAADVSDMATVIIIVNPWLVICGNDVEYCLLVWSIGTCFWKDYLEFIPTILWEGGNWSINEKKKLVEMGMTSGDAINMRYWLMKIRHIYMA